MSFKRVLLAVAAVLLVPAAAVIALDKFSPGWDLHLMWSLRPYIPESAQRGILWWTGPLRLSDDELREMGVTLVDSSPDAEGDPVEAEVE